MREHRSFLRREHRNLVRREHLTDSGLLQPFREMKFRSFPHSLRVSCLLFLFFVFLRIEKRDDG